MLNHYRKTSIQELHGQIVNLSEKLEINQTVEVAGHLVQLKQWVIESVLQVDKNYKQDFQQLIY